MSKIIITASPTEEQIIALSTLKGYPTEVTISEEVLTFEEYTALDGTITHTESLVSTPKQVPNPQSREDYIRQVYEGIITLDITNEFLRYSQNLRAESIRLENEALRANIQSVVSSEII